MTEREMLSPFGHLPMIGDRNGPGRKVPHVLPTSDRCLCSYGNFDGTDPLTDSHPNPLNPLNRP
jgi:hypothetical protein